jgi:hypothetical protein
MMMCELIINKCVNRYVSIHWNVVSFAGWKLSGSVNNIEGMVEWKMEGLVKKEVILNYFAFSACPYIPPCMVPCQLSSFA